LVTAGLQQRSALENLRRVQTQGLLASSAADLAGLPQASRIAQRIRADEALLCARQGGVGLLRLHVPAGLREWGSGDRKAGRR